MLINRHPCNPQSSIPLSKSGLVALCGGALEHLTNIECLMLGPAPGDNVPFAFGSDGLRSISRVIQALQGR